MYLPNAANAYIPPAKILITCWLPTIPTAAAKRLS